ncbi:hypothetical protein EVAR_87073_1 [Eumeta japonica]|uniref:Histone-lysine N-methyltransferase SETMAR n=1 Tax=Eumeta variegata TaxID=151549 RepID=A0A4C1VQ95_EUMVA|nr:hypothetical protein EVAR_87073_1 [Eumeta japonica]
MTMISHAETTRFLEGQKIELTDHPPYCPDLAANYFHLFPSLGMKDIERPTHGFSRRRSLVQDSTAAPAPMNKLSCSLTSAVNKCLRAPDISYVAPSADGGVTGAARCRRQAPPVVKNSFRKLVKTNLLSPPMKGSCLWKLPM